jgi:TetR/AcrR family transcriptional repressor of nem operon
MGRHREFDREAVLDRAMEAFWSRGYEATSVQELLDEMKINRGSFYDTFGDKHSLFLAAIDRYHANVLATTRARLEAPGSPKRAIVRAIREIAACALGDARRRGCFVTNSAVELAPHCSETAARVAACYGQTEEAFHDAIVRAQDAGEIDRSRDARSLARFVTCTLQGLLVVSKVNPDAAAQADVIDVMVSALR